MSMEEISTSTALMARLLAKFEGGGVLMGSVAIGLTELASRLAVENPFGDNFGIKDGRVTFLLREGAPRYITDVRSLSPEALHRDAPSLREVLARLGMSQYTLNPLLREEFAYLTHHIGDGPWQRVIPVVMELET